MLRPAARSVPGHLTCSHDEDASGLLLHEGKETSRKTCHTAVNADRRRAACAIALYVRLDPARKKGSVGVRGLGTCPGPCFQPRQCVRRLAAACALGASLYAVHTTYLSIVAHRCLVDATPGRR